MAANPFTTWGITQITVDGNLLNTEPKPTFEPGGPERSEVEGDFRAGYFKTTTKPAMLECSVIITGDVSLTWLQSLSNSTVVISLDSGQTYVMANAWVADKVSASDGKAKLKLMSQPAIEQLS